MAGQNAPYEEFIADVSKEAMDLIQAAVDNFDETFPGTPFGQSKLSDDEFALWFAQKCGDLNQQGQPQTDPVAWATGRNWMAFLALEDSGEGMATLKRYMDLKKRGIMPAAMAQPMASQPVAF